MLLTVGGNNCKADKMCWFSFIDIQYSCTLCTVQHTNCTQKGGEATARTTVQPSLHNVPV